MNVVMAIQKKIIIEEDICTNDEYTTEIIEVKSMKYSTNLTEIRYCEVKSIEKDGEIMKNENAEKKKNGEFRPKNKLIIKPYKIKVMIIMRK